VPLGVDAVSVACDHEMTTTTVMSRTISVPCNNTNDFHIINRFDPLLYRDRTERVRSVLEGTNVVHDGVQVGERRHGGDDLSGTINSSDLSSDTRLKHRKKKGKNRKLLGLEEVQVLEEQEDQDTIDTENVALLQEEREHQHQDQDRKEDQDILQPSAPEQQSQQQQQQQQQDAPAQHHDDDGPVLKQPNIMVLLFDSAGRAHSQRRLLRFIETLQRMNASTSNEDGTRDTNAQSAAHSSGVRILDFERFNVVGLNSPANFLAMLTGRPNADVWHTESLAFPMIRLVTGDRYIHTHTTYTICTHKVPPSHTQSCGVRVA